LEINRLGQRVDRADPLDLQLVGDPLSPGGIFAGPGGQTGAPGDVLTNEVSRKFWELNVAIFRLLSRQIWTGSPANNAGARREMTGLELLVNTGYVDAETGNPCGNMDSVIRNLNNARFDSEAGGTAIIANLTATYYELKRRAFRAGVAPVRTVLAMRSQMFYELTAIWPCSYLSYRCMLGGDSANRNLIDAQDAVRFRDEMRSGNYLLIDGDRIDVLVDDGIPETETSPGVFSSDIYFLPMSVVGGRSVLYMEYFQFQNPSIQDALGNMALGRIEGPWITWPRQRNLCIQWQTKIEPRMVLRTPWLAARLQNVAYAPIQHEPSPFPDEPYHVNDGKTYRTSGPSFHDLWDD
jgi:hypothetical protein